MLHANPLIRRTWVALIAIAFLSACAPGRPTTEKPELKNGQEVSEAAAKSTHEADIDALVLSSSSMDDEGDEAEEDALEDAPDAGLSDAEDAIDQDAIDENAIDENAIDGDEDDLIEVDAGAPE